MCDLHVRGMLNLCILISELEHALTQFCFECKTLDDEQGDLVSNPWDFPYAYYDQMQIIQTKLTCKPTNNGIRSETEQSG